MLNYTMWCEREREHKSSFTVVVGCLFDTIGEFEVVQLNFFRHQNRQISEPLKRPWKSRNRLTDYHEVERVDQRLVRSSS